MHLLELLLLLKPLLSLLMLFLPLRNLLFELLTDQELLLLSRTTRRLKCGLSSLGCFLGLLRVVQLTYRFIEGGVWSEDSHGRRW